MNTLARVLATSRRRAGRAGEVWRRSLQLRVVVSTLALSAAVVLVLGMVLQSEITDRLLAGKRDAAINQTRSSLDLLQPTLLGVNPGTDALKSRMASALSKLTTSDVSSASRGRSPAGRSPAGAFQPVLAAASGSRTATDVPAVGPYEQIPKRLRRFVLRGRMARQVASVSEQGTTTTYLIVGTPVSTAVRPLQLYLMFPLTAEKYTIGIVHSTLLVGGLVLVLLLAGIANLVTRQVVRPVRRAAEVAGRFAGGHLEERMPVVGEDDVAKLAESYNAMAESISEQIHQLEEFGHLQRRFTSDVSHELRTPLTTVRMAADVLHASREQFSAGLARSTELLVDELDRFESLLGDLLEISKLDAGVEELATETADVADLAAHATEAVRGLAETMGTEVVAELPEGEITAEVDPRRVERILRNLLGNAIDHGEGNPVRLIVACDEDAVAIGVRDYGIGLRSGQEDLVFNRFWRADPSRNRRTGGTGLGLAISAEDARLHGGSLRAWGVPGEGACFLLTLPRQAGRTVSESPLPLPPPEPAGRQLPTAHDDSRAGGTGAPPASDPVATQPRWQPAEDGADQLATVVGPPSHGPGADQGHST